MRALFLLLAAACGPSSEGTPVVPSTKTPTGTTTTSPETTPTDTAAPIDTGGTEPDTGVDTGTDTGETEPMDPDCLIEDPAPSVLTDESGLTERSGSIRFIARDGNELSAYTYRATGYEEDGPILFVMHGTGRTAESYLSAFAAIAERNDALAIAPEFPSELYTGSDYVLGVGTDGLPAGGTYLESEWREPVDYSYSEIEHLFEAVRMATGSTRCAYRIFGHSAGGQFVHRLLTFRPDARIERGVAANSGWYTLPSGGGGTDPNYYFPYGLQGTPMTSADLEPAFSRSVVILLGDHDTATSDEDSDLRGTDEAEAQGATRLERGHFYHAESSAVAASLGLPFDWSTYDVIGAKHDKDEMAQSAAWHLFGTPGTPPCTSSAADVGSALRFNEVHADPAGDLNGDANGDGTRSASEDEFVELVNTGSAAVCLEGWSLWDSSAQVHLFPQGVALEPGAAVVVFGGGVPTGTFGGAMVQWAAYAGELDLQNAGDSIRLLAPDGEVVTSVSWGNCGDGDCADDHWSDSLGIDQSIVRSPEETGGWVEHELVSGTPFSPGTQADGSPF